MSFVVCNNGARLTLESLVNNGLVLRLFANDVTPRIVDRTNRFVEPEGFGYEPILLSKSNWTFTLAKREAKYPTQEFLFTGDVGDVYGYFITRNVVNDLVCAERFSDGPYPIVNPGDSVEIEPRLRFPI